MKVLMVDNHTSRIQQWSALLSRYKITQLDIVRAEDLKSFQADSYDLVILTGAGGVGGFAVPTHLSDYREELKMIRERRKPLLGICVGFQAIAVAYGVNLEYRTERVKGVVDIEVQIEDPIFGSLNKFTGYESHKYFISEPPKNFDTLAKSTYNIEVIKHKNFPIYGLQFHPEATEEPNDGAILFHNFMTMVLEKQK